MAVEVGFELPSQVSAGVLADPDASVGSQFRGYIAA
jgi:hypothetical protein